MAQYPQGGEKFSSAARALVAVRHTKRKTPASGTQCLAEQGRAQKQLWLPAHQFSESERIAELVGFLLSVLQLALAEALVVCLCTAIVGRHPLFKHVLHGPGDLVGGGHQGLGGAKPSLEAPGERAQGAV